MAALRRPFSPGTGASMAVSPERSLMAGQRNAVLIGGTGAGKAHLAIAIARGRFSTSSISLTVPRARRGRAGKGRWPTTSPE